MSAVTKYVTPGATKKPEPPTTTTLATGASLLKLGHGYMGPKKHNFVLNDDHSALTWVSSNPFKSSAASRVDLTAVTRVTKGQSTVAFVKQKDNKLVKGNEALSFSIIYEDFRGMETTLDVVCVSQGQVRPFTTLMSR